MFADFSSCRCKSHELDRQNAGWLEYRHSFAGFAELITSATPVLVRSVEYFRGTKSFDTVFKRVPLRDIKTKREKRVVRIRAVVAAKSHNL